MFKMAGMSVLSHIMIERGVQTIQCNAVGLSTSNDDPVTVSSLSPSYTKENLREFAEKDNAIGRYKALSVLDDLPTA